MEEKSYDFNVLAEFVLIFYKDFNDILHLCNNNDKALCLCYYVNQQETSQTLPLKWQKILS
jgi:hypothetical protein